jgi:hypothetical protein
MNRRSIANTFALATAAGVGLLTMYVSYTRLKIPQIPLDWAALLLSGLTTAILAFFIVWGHFQTDPLPSRLLRSAEPPSTTLPPSKPQPSLTPTACATQSPCEPPSAAGPL